MALLGFFKQPTPRRYDHKPIYYDKQKEEREERYARIRKELNMEEEKDKEVRRDFEKDIRGSFKQAVPGGSKQDKISRFSRIFFIVCAILLLIVLIAYFRL